MHYFIFPQKDSYISEASPSDIIEYRDELKKNYGSDEILELRKDFIASHSTSSYAVSRFLIQFDYTTISQSLVDNEITNPKYYMRLYEIEGQKETPEEYTISAYALSQSWVEGSGKRYDTPATTDSDVSWLETESGSVWDINVDALTFGEYFSEFDEASQSFGQGTTHDWVSSGSRAGMGGGAWIPIYKASQSFNAESPDIEMDVTNIVNAHLSSEIPNYGFIFKFSGSYEGDDSRLSLKFFSKQTHTIYAPKLEVRWDDHLPCTGSNTGSLSPLNLGGEIKNHIFIRGLKTKYTEDEKVRFRLGCRKKYVQKTFTESVHNSSFFIPENGGFYSIVDVATDTPIIPFSEYTKLSCDSNSPYFEQILNTFEPGRYYKIIFKLIYDDGQEIIYDNNDEFKVV